MGARALATMKSVAKTTAIGAKARLAKLGATGLGSLQIAGHYMGGSGSGDGKGPSIVDHVQNAVDAGAKAKGLYTQVTDLISPLGQVPGGLASVAYSTATSPSTLAGVGACAGLWYLAHGIQRDQTAAVRDGRTISG